MQSFLLLAFLCLGNVLADDSRMETVVAVTRCRASCLDQHAHVIRTEENCQKNPSCLMCWETCQMLHEHFEIWGIMCSVPDVCFPGCKTACQSLSYRSFLNETEFTPITINSVYDLSTSRVMLKWLPLDNEGTVLYTVMFQDSTQEWHQVAQTTLNVIHVKANLVGRETTIRVIAANATNQLSYSETTFVSSLVLGTKHAAFIKDNNWSPQLVSLERDETSTGILATITWPELPDEMGPLEYEVSWNVVDNTMITGHLLTTKNMAVITLWPDSIHLVTVDRYKSAGIIFGDSSQALVINTKVPVLNSKVSKSTDDLCKKDKVEVRTVIYYWIISFLSLIIIVIFIYGRMKGQIKNYQDKYSNQVSLMLEKSNAFRQLLQDQVAKKFTKTAPSQDSVTKCDAKIVKDIQNFQIV
ncbi:hypothetical protein JTE90_005263 [Oedothorax gibbosus]|uniref:Fibronectin type-III domain-containing protein n=1 Tax=Oedothorax gibbosus TaxID=931172 RepID=A0AAV6U6N1_9ARAC|nr:hypothetical protein JTE90_005263 [Oedothorax gibbosus]